MEIEIRSPHVVVAPLGYPLAQAQAIAELVASARLDCEEQQGASLIAACGDRIAALLLDLSEGRTIGSHAATVISFSTEKSSSAVIRRLDPGRRETHLAKQGQSS